MKNYALFFAWGIACVATFMSMYLSERLFLEPCELCWYQRICMFPLVIILGRASWKADFGGIAYALPFVFAGFALALYHILLQEVIHFDPIGLCDLVHECSSPQLFHFWRFAIPIPMVSAAAFFVLLVLLFVARHTDQSDRI